MCHCGRLTFACRLCQVPFYHEEWIALCEKMLMINKERAKLDFQMLFKCEERYCIRTKPKGIGIDLCNGRGTCSKDDKNSRDSEGSEDGEDRESGEDGEVGEGRKGRLTDEEKIQRCREIVLKMGAEEIHKQYVGEWDVKEGGAAVVDLTGA
ncbi:hypothetical protein OQA88_4310 [Cercophora sp. LCS_1]